MKHVFLRIPVIALLLIFVMGQAASALSETQAQLFQENVNYFDAATCGTALASDTTATAVTAGTGAPDGTQFPNLDPGDMATAINTYIKQNNSKSELNNLGTTIVASAKNANVSPFVIVAIAQQESGLANPSDYNVSHGHNAFGRTAAPGQPSFQGAQSWYKWSSAKASVDYTAAENQHASGGGDEASYLVNQYGSAIKSNDISALVTAYDSSAAEDAIYIPDVTQWVKSMANLAAGSNPTPVANASPTRGSGSASLVWPFSTKSNSQYDRVDQGWDIQDKPSSSVYAIAPGTLHVYNADPGNFGNDYPTEELDNDIGGPSKTVYYGHVHILDGLNGKHVDAGQKIATTNGPGADVSSPQNGSGAPPGWLEIGFAHPGTDAPLAIGSDPSPQGQKMKDLLINTSPATGTTATPAPTSGSSDANCCSGSGSSTPVSTPTAPTSGTEVPDGQLPGSSPREKIWNYLISQGWTPVQAAGIEGNIGAEGVYDPTNIQDPAGQTKDPSNLTSTSQGWGLFGFTPGDSIFGKPWSISGVKVTKDNVYYMSTQMDVIYGYMKHSTGDGGGNMYQEYVNQATSPAAAAESFMNEVENPYVPTEHLAKRQKFANDAMNDFGSGAAAASVNVSLDTGSGSSGSAGSCCPSSGSTGTSDAALTGGSNEEKAYNYFVSKGLTPQQSAGIVGNLMLESGMDPTIVEGGGDSKTPTSGGWGIAQWTPGTGITSIASAAHVTGPIAQLGTQLDILWAELTGKAGSSDDSQVLRDVKSTTTVEDAVLAFQGNQQVGGKYYGFERPQDEAGSVPTRTTYAKTALHNYGGGAGDASVSVTGDCAAAASQGPVNIIQHNSFGTADGLMGHKPTMIGLHYTAGHEQTVDDVVSALSDPNGAKGCNKSCSVQLTVDPKGNVYQLTSRLDVITENIINFNDADIGIEIMGANEGALLNNKAQFDAVTALVTQLMQQYNIPMAQDFKNKSGLMGHMECDEWSQAHLGTNFEGTYKGDPAVESTDSHSDPGKTYMSKVRAVVGPALQNGGAAATGPSSLGTLE